MMKFGNCVMVSKPERDAGSSGRGVAGLRVLAYVAVF